MLSEAFQLALFKHRRKGGRMYRLALDAGLSPSMFSAMVHGARRVDRTDSRIIKIGQQLGLTSSECFTEPDRTVPS
jgi:hypothetical protein